MIGVEVGADIVRTPDLGSMSMRLTLICAHQSNIVNILSIVNTEFDN